MRFSESVSSSISLADGWELSMPVRPSKLGGSNGLRLGPDKRIYVAQAIGSKLSAVDLTSGEVEVIADADGPILQPDDLDFDSKGSLFVTEVMAGRVSALRRNGAVDTIATGVISANGIHIHEDRIFMDEFRPGGRILELYDSADPPRVIAENLPGPNALAVGPDGYIYFPAMLANEVWRVPVDGGVAECVTKGVDAPVAVKFHPTTGLWVLSAGDGSIWRINVKSGTKTLFGAVKPGADNFDFVGEDLVTSNFVEGGLTYLSQGQPGRMIVDTGMVGPWGLSCSRSGELLIADGLSLAVLSADGQLVRASSLFSDSHFRPFVRNVVTDVAGTIFVANSGGEVARLNPHQSIEVIASGMGQVMGMTATDHNVVVACDYESGELIKTESGEVRTIARRLGRPTGLADAGGGTFFVADAGGGRVLRVEAGSVEVIAEGLSEPHGLALFGSELFVVDRRLKSLSLINIDTRLTTTIGQNLPVGHAPGVSPNVLPGVPGILPGPILPFAGIAVNESGEVYVSGDGNHSVIKISRREKS